MTKQSKNSQQQPIATTSKTFPLWMFALIISISLSTVGFFVLRSYQNSDKRKVLSSLSQLNLNGTEPQVVTKIQNLEEQVKKHPGTASAWGKLAMNLDVHDFENEAIPIYKQAASLDQADFRWSYFLSVLLAKKGDPQSLDWFERARKIKPDYAPMFVNYGNALFQFNKNDRATQQYLQAIASDPKCAQAYFGLARIQFAEGNLKESAQNLKQALQINPKYSEASNLLMTVCNRLKSSDCVVSLVINSPYKTELIDPVYAELTAEGESSLWYRSRGTDYFRNGNYDKAIVEFEKALQLREDAQTHEDLAQALSSSGRFTEAAQHYIAAINTHPIANNYFRLGLVFARSAQYEQSEQNFKKAIELKPDFAEAYLNLAVVYAKTHRLPEAMDNLKQAIQYNPNYVDAHFYLGQSYLATGDHSGADQEYQILSKLDPGAAKRFQALMQQK